MFLTWLDKLLVQTPEDVVWKVRNKGLRVKGFRVVGFRVYLKQAVHKLFEAFHSRVPLAEASMTGKSGLP